MEAKTKKKMLSAIGSLFIGAGVIWGAIGVQIENLPFVIILIAIGCVLSYLGKRITV